MVMRFDRLVPVSALDRILDEGLVRVNSINASVMPLAQIIDYISDSSKPHFSNERLDGDARE